MRNGQKEIRQAGTLELQVVTWAKHVTYGTDGPKLLSSPFISNSSLSLKSVLSGRVSTVAPFSFDKNDTIYPLAAPNPWDFLENSLQ